MSSPASKPTGEDARFLLTILGSMKNILEIDWKAVGRSGYGTAKHAREKFEALQKGGNTGESSSAPTSSTPTSSSVVVAAAACTENKRGSARGPDFNTPEEAKKIDEGQDEGQDVDMEWVDVGELEDNGSEYGDIIIGMDISRPRTTIVLD